MLLNTFSPTDHCYLLYLQQEVRRSLITGTAATSLMATFLMGAVANMPLAVAPGMGEFVF